jgi:hypothetical protein
LWCNIPKLLVLVEISLEADSVPFQKRASRSQR